jgi:catechol 2,3-dioxygenase-like lactoylglutathione lyase family enzyme
VERVLGIGGAFFRSERPDELRAWYARHLGLELQPYGGVTFRAEAGDVTIWHAFEGDTEYFPREQAAMLNYRVRDLDAMLAQLRAAGVRVKDEVDDSEHGRFGWAWDPEGRLLELWQPPTDPYPEG